MDNHDRRTQLERLEVVETGRRRRWSDDEKLRIVTESFDSARDIVDGKTPWPITFVADDMAALIRSLSNPALRGSSLPLRSSRRLLPHRRAGKW
jgi:hypothetical protein